MTDTKTVIEPIGDRVVVERVEQPDTVDRGGVTLYVPDQAKNPPQIGLVIAVGPGIPYRGPGKVTKTVGGVPSEEELHEPQPLPVQVGEYVLYGRFSGVEVELHDESISYRRSLFVLRADEVLAKLKNYTPPQERQAEQEDVAASA